MCHDKKSCELVKVWFSSWKYISKYSLLENGVLQHIFIYCFFVWPLKWNLWRAKMTAYYIYWYSYKELLSFKYWIRRYKWKELSVIYLHTYLLIYILTDLLTDYPGYRLIVKPLIDVTLDLGGVARSTESLQASWWITAIMYNLFSSFGHMKSCPLKNTVN